ncbi:shikimate kinase [Gammaproteobacteria bacterium]|nr:shikimate kinase [Gammaproteobacteria bacterium]MDB4242718.1 shikimate kinase [Gammaproteobacteria bacterium]MDC0090140.1 shikimate kinase [Gammaproteobacteria bacterium]
MNNSISLIGMAGAGKSSIGTELAKQLNFQFIDSDALIEAKFNQTLQNILDDSGYLKLRDIEEETILSIEFSNSVLATGGSAVYSAKAMQHLKQNSLVIYLEVPFDQILQRVPSFLDRGFAKQPKQSIEDAFQERQALYVESAHHVILNTDDLSSCITKILSLL